VFNGSPLFTGDAGSGESNIRRWIIENDWLDAVVALPDQMFYNTGIFTYVWLVTNRKPAHRRGKVQLIDGTRHFQKMKKSLGDKRNELSDAHIRELVRLYGDCEADGMSEVLVDGQVEKRVCSKIFRNQDFGFLKVVVERPLRLNFQVSQERIANLWEQSAFVGLAESKKRKDKGAIATDVAAGEALQKSIVAVLEDMDQTVVYLDRSKFLKVLDKAFKVASLGLASPVKKAVLAALSERDAGAVICCDGKGKPEPDSELRDTEIVPLPEGIGLPLPLGYDEKQAAGHEALVKLVRSHCEAYLRSEVLPHVPDAWIDYSKTKMGYEIPLNRHFYVYQPPRSLEVIEAEIKGLEQEIMAMLGEVV
jgi:type I restriction enzyme M protein